ncbi:unnamed protein product [Lactuca saligna]|uniref:Uncharacterized protein n=1 Tax=Lactuca saligna TaxID=75948 RepID=A0AA36E0H2_LACSI|nr:unnamed protein product [Lactuca saligna]
MITRSIENDHKIHRGCSADQLKFLRMDAHLYKNEVASLYDKKKFRVLRIHRGISSDRLFSADSLLLCGSPILPYLNAEGDQQRSSAQEQIHRGALCGTICSQDWDVSIRVTGRVVEYGETKFCLISDLRCGPYVDIINTKVSTSSALRNQLFPNVRDEDLRLKDLEEYIKGSAFSTCSNEDAVMVMQMMLLLTGLIGRDSNTCIPPTVYELR